MPQRRSSTATGCESISTAVSGLSRLVVPAKANRPAHGRVASGRAACRTWIKERLMLYTLAVILLIAWLLGVVGTYTIGAFVHVLLVVAIVLFLVGLISSRETLV